MMYVAIKLHKSQVPYKVSKDFVIQIHDVSPEDYDEEDGIGAYSIKAIVEVDN